MNLETGTFDLLFRDRHLVELAVLQYPNASDYESMRVVGEFSGGRSGARVLEALLENGRGSRHPVILKLDTAARLNIEINFSAAHRHCSSFLPVVAQAIVEAHGCIIYSHGSSQQPGELLALEDLCRRTFEAESGEIQPVLDLIRRALGCLDKQLRASGYVTGRPQELFDYYVQAWHPSATLVVDDVSLSKQSLCFSLLGDSETTELKGDQYELDEAWQGRSISFYGNGLYLDEAVWVNVKGIATFRLEGVTPARVGSVLNGATMRTFVVKGRVKDSRAMFYRRVYGALKLDALAENLEVAGLSFRNPLPCLDARRAEWMGLEPCHFAAGHGDLHGGNILSAEGTPLFIDHAGYRSRQPLWADAARLIGSLWCNVLMPLLSPDEQAHVLDAAFRQQAGEGGGGADRIARMAAFLRGALRCVLEAVESKRPSDAREFWQNLHHFTWVAVKWGGERAKQPGVILLAAISGEKAEAEQRAVERQLALNRLPERAEEVPGFFGNQLRYWHDGLAKLGSATDDARALINELIGQDLEASMQRLQKDSAARGGLVERLLSKVVTGEWTDNDRRLAQRVRNAELHDQGDRVVLVDVLLMAFAYGDHKVLPLLLDLGADGEEAVELEVALALSWLLEQDVTRDYLNQQPKIKKRLQRLLSNETMLDWITAAQEARREYSDREMPEALAKQNLEGYPLVAWLRPQDIRVSAGGGAGALEDQLVSFLGERISLGQIVNRVIVDRLAELGLDHKQNLRIIFAVERIDFAMRSPEIPILYHRWDALYMFMEMINHSGKARILDLKTKLRQPLWSLIEDARLAKLAFARETSEELEKLVAEEHWQELAKQAIKVDESFEALVALHPLGAGDLKRWVRCLMSLYISYRPGQGVSQETRTATLEKLTEKQAAALADHPNAHEDTSNWGYQLGQLAALAETKAEARSLGEAAIEQYKQAVAIKPDMHEALYNWGVQLEELAALAETKAEARGLREAAIEQYKQAVVIKPDKHEALYNWGYQLGELAALAETKAQARSLREAAIEQYKQAVAIKPDKHEALNNWGVQLGQLAALAETKAEARSLREAAIEQYMQAVAIKPDMHEALNNWSINCIHLYHLAEDRESGLEYLSQAEDLCQRGAQIEGIPLEHDYNYACVLALRGVRALALAALAACLAAGTIGAEHVAEDEDWLAFREDEGWRSLLGLPPLGALA